MPGQGGFIEGRAIKVRVRISDDLVDLVGRERELMQERNGEIAAGKSLNMGCRQDTSRPF